MFGTSILRMLSCSEEAFVGIGFLIILTLVLHARFLQKSINATSHGLQGCFRFLWCKLHRIIQILCFILHNLSLTSPNASIKLVTNRFCELKWTLIFDCNKKNCEPYQKAEVGRHTRPPTDKRFAYVHVDITGPLPFCDERTNLLANMSR